MQGANSSVVPRYFTGVHTSYYDNGHIRTKRNYVNSKEHGEVFSYEKCKKIECDCRIDSQHPVITTNYQNGKKHGNRTSYAGIEKGFAVKKY